MTNSVKLQQDKTAATDKYDYECSNGEGWIETVQTPLWNPVNTDKACWSNSACDSGVCVVTNVTDSTLGTKVGVCKPYTRTAATCTCMTRGKHKWTKVRTNMEIGGGMVTSSSTVVDKPRQVTSGTSGTR